MKFDLTVAFLILGMIAVEWYVFLAFRKLRKENEELNIKLLAVKSFFMDKVVELDGKLLGAESFFTEKMATLEVKQDILGLKVRAITDAITAEPLFEENDGEETLAPCEEEREV